MWFFITFPISGTLLLALILLGLSTGANITEVLVNILNEHQKLLIILIKQIGSEQPHHYYSEW